jgi:hypothetical protein
MGSRNLRRVWRTFVVVVTLVGFNLVLAGVASGATLTVCSSGCQFTTIADALSAASNGDTIAVGPGTYEGGFTISVSISLVGAGSSMTTISGGGPVVTIASLTSATISGVTISDGSAFVGGGIENDGTLVLTDSVVNGNTASGGGGGIVNSPGQTLTITNTTVSDNIVSGFGEGGGINNFFGTLTLTDSTVSNNTAPSGGGILNNGPLTVNNSTIRNNTASPPTCCSYATADGGGIKNGYSGVVTLADSSVIGNTAAGGNASIGGGIFNLGSLTFTNSPVSNNTASASLTGGSAYGGGIAQFGGSTTLTSSPVTGNTASASGSALGGGIFLYGTLTLTNSPVAGNTASAPSALGGGIYSNGTVTVTNSPVRGNKPDDCVGC